MLPDSHGAQMSAPGSTSATATAGLEGGHRDRAHREDGWAKFAADLEWKALVEQVPRADHGNVCLMSATDYHRSE